VVSVTQVSWFRARELCLKRGMILATFVKKETYEEVAEKIFDFSVYDKLEVDEWLGARRYWIGLSDLGMEGEWRWYDTGEVLSYSKWYPGQPDHIMQLPWLTHWIRAYNPELRSGKEGMYVGTSRYISRIHMRTVSKVYR